MRHELSVGEVAERSMIRSRCTGGNQRRYGRDALRRVAIIKVAGRRRLATALRKLRDELTSG